MARARVCLEWTEETLRKTVIADGRRMYRWGSITLQIIETFAHLGTELFDVTEAV